jgi:BTB/POZ domain-containing protein 13
MGNLIGSFGGRNPSPAAPSRSSLAATGEVQQRQRKRGRKGGGGKEEGDSEEVEELSPRRKRIQTTSSYIYDTLFMKGVNADVSIAALGKEWKLHRLYLCQSGYFSGMFSGSWKESEEHRISLDIPDPNITTEALDLAFSSLYRDEVHMSATDITSTVAAASMLQMDGLLEHCRVFMRETMRHDTVVHYLDTSSLYGLTDVERECEEWLKVNVVKNHTIDLLKTLTAGKMEELISSHDLFVLQVEMDVYTMAKRWLYLVLHPDDTPVALDTISEAAEAYFRHQEPWFLKTEEGQQYCPVFRALRLQHIMNDIASIRLLEADRIVPHEWLYPLYKKQWQTMCMVEQRLEHGPFKLTESQFNECSFRCGRVLHDNIEYCWRWTGYFYGVDIIITYYPNTGHLSVKRNTKSLSCDTSVSLQQMRKIVMRLRAVSLGSQSEVTFREDTGLLKLNLGQDEEHSLPRLGNNFTFPLYISVNMALTSNDSDNS